MTDPVGVEPLSDEVLRVIAAKMGAFGIDIENVELTSAGFHCGPPERVTTIADLASALLRAREALWGVVENGPCSDPDCCDTAIRCEEARKAARSLLPPTAGV